MKNTTLLLFISLFFTLSAIAPTKIYNLASNNLIDFTDASSRMLTSPSTSAFACNFPSGLVVTNITETSFKASWSSVSGASSYRVEKALNSGSYTGNPIQTSSTSYTFTGLNTGGLYKFQVGTNCSNSTKSDMSGSYFNIQLLTPLNYPELTAPANNASLSNTSVTFQWSKNGNPSGTSYYFRLVQLPSTVLYNYSNEGSATSKTVTLTAGKSYRWIVSARKSGNEDKESASREFSIAAPTCNLSYSSENSGSASSITTSSFTGSWPAVSGATQYQINYAKYSDNYPSPSDIYTTSTSYNFTGLDPATRYKFQIRAKCSNGIWKDDWSPTQASPTTLALTCDIPTNLGISNITETSFRGTWSSVSGASNYRVEAVLSSNSYTGNTNQTGSTSYTFTGLNSGGLYKFQVGANCTNGASSDMSGSRTDIQLAPPLNYPLLTAPANNETLNSISVTFQWSKNNNPSGTSYYFRLVELPSTVLYDYTNERDATSKTITLTAGKSYRWIISARKSGNIDRESASRVFSIAAAACNVTYPAENSGSFSNVTATGFIGSWPAVSGATQYQINYAKEGSDYPFPALELYSNTASYTFTGLQPNTKYKFQIRAKCSNGVWSEAWSPTLARPTTDVPINVNPFPATMNWNCNQTITWTSAPGTGNVSIELINASDGSVKAKLADGILNTGTFTWVVGKEWNGANYYQHIQNFVGGTYKLKMYPTGTTGQGKPTTATFTINTPVITIAEPTATTYYKGQTMNIAWSTSGDFCGPVTIEYVPVGSSSPVLIIADTPNDGAHPWVIPASLANGSYYIKIYAPGPSAPNPIAKSSPNFTIATNTACPACLSTGITEANFPGTGYEGFCAAQYLCGLSIIQPQQNNTGYTPVDPLKRADLAKLVLYALFDDGYANTYNLNPALLVFPVDTYVTPFEDLKYNNNPANYDRAAKIMSYLYYANDTKGLTPFKRTRTNFYPYENINRVDFLQVLLEAWNVPSDATTQNNIPFTDEELTGMPEENKQYIRKAYSLGIINFNAVNNPKFRPYEPIKREEAFTILARLRKLTTVTKPAQATLTNAVNYIFERNITTENISIMRSMGEGNFAYGEEGFAIPDIGFPLSFGFSYNSFSTHLPDVYRTIEPLGIGWTHNLNSYIQTTAASVDAGNVVVGKPLLLLANGDGTWHTYDNSNPASLVKRTTDNFNTLTLVANTYYELKRPDLVTFKYEKQGSETGLYRLTSIKDRYNNVLTIVYKNGAIVPFSGYRSVIDYVQAPSGRRATFAYNAANQITEISFPGKTQASPRKLKFEYYQGWDGKSNYLRKYTSARFYGTAKGTVYTYGTGLKKYLLESIKRPKGNEIKTEFGTDNKLQKIEEINGANKANTTTIARTQAQCPVGTTCVNITNPDNTITSQKINLAGTIYDFTSPTVHLVRPDNDANPSNPAYFEVNGKRTKYEYNGLGMVLRVDYLKSDNTTTHSYETFGYNPTYNNLESHRDPNGNITKFEFSDDGKYLNAIRKPFADNQYINQTFTYYTNGLLKEAINHELLNTKFYYDAYGNTNRVEFPVLSINSYASYDYAGRVATTTNAKGKVSTFEQDDNDNLTKTIAPAPLNYLTQYGYDDNDLMATITNAKNKTTTIGRDNFDRTTSISFEGMVQKYTYRTDGKLDKYEKTGFTTNTDRYYQYAYDTEGRLKSNRYLSNTTFDNTTKNLTSVSGGTSPGHLLKEFAFDELNRMSSYTDNNNIKVGYGYDNNGNVTRIDYPNSHKVYYTYDQANRLLTIKWNTTTIATYVYVGSRLSYVQYGNGVRTTYNYDNAGRLQGMTTKKNNGGGNTLAAYTFEFDNLGNHLAENITEPYSTVPVPVASDTTNYTYSPNNQILKADTTNFKHDGDGNVITKGGITYTYDLEDNLISITGNGLNISFEYDALGNRRIANRNGTITKYVLDLLGMADVLAELNDSNAPLNYYIHGLGLVARVKGDGTTIHYYHADFRGSVVAMTNSSQSITHQYQYDEYGNLTNSQEADANPFRYVGTYGIMYENADLSYMRARYYDPTIGRFNSTDPIWSTNLYPYAGNNPVMNVDPLGMDYIEACMGWQATIGIGYEEQQCLQLSTKSFSTSTKIIHRASTTASAEAYGIISANKGNIPIIGKSFITDASIGGDIPILPLLPPSVELLTNSNGETSSTVSIGSRHLIKAQASATQTINSNAEVISRGITLKIGGNGDISPIIISANQTYTTQDGTVTWKEAIYIIRKVVPIGLKEIFKNFFH